MVLLVLLVVSVAVANLPLSRAGVQYNFYGCLTEWGIGTVNPTWCIAFLENEAPVRFGLNGTHVWDYSSGVENVYPVNETHPFVITAANHAVSFSYDLGYNISRVFYTNRGSSENIYVVVPFASELFNTYTFNIVDLVGLNWGYLESLININGSTTVVERWDINTLDAISMTFVWGKTYNIRLVCDRGAYLFPTFTAGATQSRVLTISADLFFVAKPDPSGLTMSAWREEEIVYFYYRNIHEDTNYFIVSLYRYNTNTVVYSEGFGEDFVSGYYAFSEAEDYYAILTSDSASFGVQSITVSLPLVRDVSYEDHPFAVLRELGNLPFDAAQLPAILILLVMAVVFSWYHLLWGLVFEVIVAAFLVYFGWLTIGWGWMAVVASIAMVLVFSEQKSREMG